MDLTILQKSYVVVPLAMIVYYITVYLIDSMTKQKEDSKTYTKSSIVVGVLAFFIVYIHKLIPPIEEVITTPPPF